VTSRTIRVWRWAHEWSSLICTAFILIACVTGLPLIFRDEIRSWGLNEAVVEAGTGHNVAASIDAMVRQSLAERPKLKLLSITEEEDAPEVRIFMAPSWEGLERNPQSGHWIFYNRYTGAFLRQRGDRADKETREPLLLSIALAIHANLLAGDNGKIFQGVMAIVFLVAIISGVVLYAPFMRKHAFGAVRTRRGARLKWLDLHNLLGITLLAWTIVVGVTGAVNEFDDMIGAYWERTEVAPIIQAWARHGGAPTAEPVSIDQMLETVGSQHPGMRIGGLFSPTPDQPHHYSIQLVGSSAFSSHLVTTVLVDARNGEVTGAVPTPWYMNALNLSAPLHYGDYGGLPLKIIWALLDLVTIIVLGSGLYLWLAKRRPTPARSADEAAADVQPAGLLQAAE